MLRDNNKNDTSNVERKSQRQRLNVLTSAPTMKDMMELLNSAEKARGTLFELPIRGSHGTLLLSCQSDVPGGEPSWTMYEGEDGAVQAWSYMTGNLEMIFEIVNMTLMSAPKKAEGGLPTVSMTDSGQLPDLGAMPAPVLEETKPFTGPGWETLINQPAQPTYNYVAPDTQTSGVSTQRPSFTESAPVVSEVDRFISYLDSKPNVTVSELSLDPQLPTNCIDAVLKLQEMVLTGHFNERTAIAALKMAARNGGRVDESVITQAKAQVGSDPNVVLRKAAEVMQNAGFITEVDIQQAEAKLGNHQNDFGSALMASGKVDKIVLDAAKEAYDMIAAGRLRQDQAIIALHYCARSRTNLQDALSSLSIDII